MSVMENVSDQDELRRLVDMGEVTLNNVSSTTDS